MLASELGVADRPEDATLSDALERLPGARPTTLAGVSTDQFDRLVHSHGQSFPDLVAVRTGSIATATDGVAHPTSPQDVRDLIRGAGRSGVALVPYGGGTSVVGGVNRVPGERPVVTVDLGRLNRLHDLDERSLLATFGAGTAGPDLEASLRVRGLTLGHFPQSFEQSTLGGWVATRSSGQQSLGFGRIEQLFAGGRLETPTGPLVMQPFPASAAGPDLRHAVLGSEGRLGILTEAVVRVRRLPEVDAVVAAVLPGWSSGVSAARALAQDGSGLCMVRLSTPAETATSFLLAGRAGRALSGALDVTRLGPDRCLLLAGVMGATGQARQAGRHLRQVVRQHKGVYLSRPLGAHWQRRRFQTPYLRHGLWELGYGVDTVETATTWSAVPQLVRELERALRDAVEDPVHVGTHLSHVYPTGSSVYTTFVFRLGVDPETTLDRWGRLTASARRAVAGSGGTISHQHGVGLHHLDELANEKGPIGTTVLRALLGSVDPDGLMNPGKLLP
jgi:alkyldihydroxyacetonephosphate synthase